MTSQSEKSKDKKDENKNTKKHQKICLTETCIQACAWILLTLGLCIIVTTFYLAIHQKYANDNGSNNEFNKNIINGQNNIANDKNYAAGGGSVGEGIIELPVVGDDDDVENSPKTGRFLNSSLFETISNNLSGCHEIKCKVACSHDENVYTTLHETLEVSTCPSIDVLLLDEQEFTRGILKNNWMPINLSVHEFVLRSCSNLIKIKSEAFNTPLFMHTYLMSWSRLRLEKVENGALLGLFKLKYLTIDACYINELEPAFFQPVQTTLSHLKLDASLTLNGNRNIFGISYMSQLEYLDLSHNRINGVLTKRMFRSTPHLKYLLLTETELQSIEEDAFTELSDSLIFLNLSKNLLTTLTVTSIQPILYSSMSAVVSLSRNNWLCDCDLRDLAELYSKNRNQFMDALYCTAPHFLYGIFLDEVDFKPQNCDIQITTDQKSKVENDDISSTTPSQIQDHTTADIVANDSADSLIDSTEEVSNENNPLFKMRCFNKDSSSASSSSSDSGANSFSYDMKRDIEVGPDFVNDGDIAFNEYFQFEPPTHQFEVTLLPENNTALINIETDVDLSDIIVIWFSEQQESRVVVYDELKMDYDCMRYPEAAVTVGPLIANTTYTFCLIRIDSATITPFNCLPLHVPIETEEDEIWISQENKQFTIGMLCLIFALSIIFGAVIGYFGIKTYPDLLEGSKKVLVVKKPDQACYVSTISEIEYQKQSSMKKRKEQSMKKKGSLKKPLPPSPPPIYDAGDSALPQMSIKHLKRLSSLKSTSTCFELDFNMSSIQDNNDAYETPKMCENMYSFETNAVPNSYATSPKSPPPLPKRNSNISDSSVAMNRFSRKMD